MFGNIVDNAFDPKPFLVACSILLGLFFIGMALFLELTNESINWTQQYIVLAKDSSMIVYAGLEAFTLV